MVIQAFDFARMHRLLARIVKKVPEGEEIIWYDR